MSQLNARLMAKYRAEVSQEVFERSVERGNKVGEVVWNWFTNDPVAYNHYKNPFQGYDWKVAYKKKEIGFQHLQVQINQWVECMDVAELLFYKEMEKNL